MGKRERRYLALKKSTKIGLRNLRNKVWGNMWDYGIAGTHVFLNDKGHAEIKVLSIDECLDLLEKKNKGEELPEGISLSI